MLIELWRTSTLSSLNHVSLLLYWGDLILHICTCQCNTYHLGMYPPCMVWCGVSRSVVSNSATLWTVACQAPLSMEFSRQEYWSGLPFPSPGYLPNPGIEPMSPALSRLITPSTKHVGSSMYSRYMIKYLSIMTTLYVVPLRTQGHSIYFSKFKWEKVGMANPGLVLFLKRKSASNLKNHCE